MVMKFCGWIDLGGGWGGGGWGAVHMNLISCLLHFELLSFVFIIHEFCPVHVSRTTSYGYEISWMVTTWGKTGVSFDNLPLLFNKCVEVPIVAN